MGKKVEAPKKGGCGCSSDKKVEAPKKGGCGCSSKKKVEAPKKGGCGCSGDKKPAVLKESKDVTITVGNLKIQVPEKFSFGENNTGAQVQDDPEITITVGGKRITIKIEDLN